jgi:hypothetical protein
MMLRLTKLCCAFSRLLGLKASGSAVVFLTDIFFQISNVCSMEVNIRINIYSGDSEKSVVSSFAGKLEDIVHGMSRPANLQTIIETPFVDCDLYPDEPHLLSSRGVIVGSFVLKLTREPTTLPNPKAQPTSKTVKKPIVDAIEVDPLASAVECDASHKDVSCASKSTCGT